MPYRVQLGEGRHSLHSGSTEPAASVQVEGSVHGCMPTAAVCLRQQSQWAFIKDKSLIDWTWHVISQAIGQPVVCSPSTLASEAKYHALTAVVQYRVGVTFQGISPNQSSACQLLQGWPDREPEQSSGQPYLPFPN
jgi:hypothetical protein